MDSATNTRFTTRNVNGRRIRSPENAGQPATGLARRTMRPIRRAPIAFDGEHDALLHAFDREGHSHEIPQPGPGPNPFCGNRLPPNWVTPTCATTYKPPRCGPGCAAPTCSSTAAAANYSSTSAGSRRHPRDEIAFPNALASRRPRPRGRWLIDTIPASRRRLTEPPPWLAQHTSAPRRHRLATPASLTGCAPPLRHRCSR